jgi:hypothetical protein
MGLFVQTFHPGVAGSWKERDSFSWVLVILIPDSQDMMERNKLYRVQLADNLMLYPMQLSFVL